MGRFADFDAALAPAEPLRVRLLGQEWELYGELPAATALRIVEWESDPERVLTDAEVVQVIRELVPPDVLEAWLGAGIGLETLSEILKRLIALYLEGDGEQEAEADPKAPTASLNASD